METIRSKDGTPIAVYRSGAGMPLVLVHGGLSLGVRWHPLLPLLERNFAIYLVDRRGRGGSGEGEPYAIEREFEDIAAVVESIGEPVNLLGHSYGALCCLEATRLTNRVRRLIAYEPPLFDDNMRAGVGELLDEFQRLLDAGKREELYITFNTRLVGMPIHEIEVQRAQPDLWNARMAIVHTVVRELAAAVNYQFIPERFRDVTTPVLFLLGGESPQWLKTATEKFRAAMPNSRVRVMPGQRHIAMDTAPDLFVCEMTDFVMARL
jgi:pimeloyl-ACP methyl ester carboxylesterase